MSPEGVKQKQGYDLWAETANGKGGIKAGGKTYKVEIVYADYASNTPRAVQTAERMITDDKVSLLFSPFGSGATKAASGVSEKYGIPTVAATASSAQVYDQGYKYLFGTFTPNDTLTEPLANIVTKHNANVKRVAILARNDLFPLAIGEEMQKSAKKRNLDVVMFEKYAIGTLDHASAITQMRARTAGLGIRDRIYQRPDPDQEADEGPRRRCAGGHHDRRPRLQGVRRRGRTAG